jgi:iron only hydrogenase large subunit-like protein
MPEKLIEIIEKKCTLCYACVRECPVKAIEVKTNNDYATILENRCIGCGSCIAVCPEKAIVFHTSKNQTKEILKSKHKVVAIVAPSISGEFPDISDYRKFVGMIRALGFDYVTEASFGVDLVANAYKELLANFKGKYYITSLCPVVVSNIEKFHPELIDNLAPIVSPMIASARVAKQLYGNDINTVYIGPCLENKHEKEKYEDVDVVLSFIELRQLFNESKIEEKKLEFSDFDPPFGNKGSLYPLSNGIIEAAELDQDSLTSSVITTEGRDDFIEAIKKFETSVDQIQKHFNIFYCDGCLMGPGTSPNGEKYLRRTMVVDYAKKRAQKFDKKIWEENINKFKDIPLKTSFSKNDQRIKNPDEETIQGILKLIGKEENIDKKGCADCGYDSCREFAIAVHKGLAKTEMCRSYSIKNKQEYIKALKVTNEKLAHTQSALKKSEKVARKEKEAAKEANEIVNAMLQELPSGIVILDKDLKIIQSNKKFIHLLGDEAESIAEVIPGLIGADLKTLIPVGILNFFSYVLSNNTDVVNKDVKIEENLLNLSIFTIKKDKIIGAIFRDMFSPEVRSEEVIKRVNDVINKNLEMVQQIGFLLGEGASDTEQMLNSIKRSFQSKKKK